MNVLLVDDDVELCALLTRYLQRNGCRVFPAHHPLEGLAILEREQVGMIITDLMMPHVDGIAFTERVKSDPRFKDIPVILITANDAEGVAEEGLRKGVALTLTKPFDFSRLLDLLRFAQ